MTEAEWLTCTDPEKILPFLSRSSNRNFRKRRLLGVAN
jgi:hypothetical protein